MLGKLLKYDLKATFKYWWILAITSFGASIFGGVCFNVFYNTMNEAETVSGPEAFFSILAMLGFIMTIIVLAAFIVVSEIFIYIRFFKSFFSDEGYLTFTLPVKRHQLLTSKLLMAFITEFCTVTLYVIEMGIIFSFVFSNMLNELGLDTYTELFSFFSELGKLIFTAENALSIIFLLIYLLEMLIIYVLSASFMILVTFACITFGAIVAKKHKVLAAIGIYYLVSSTLSSIASVVMLATTMGLPYWFDSLTPNAAMGVVALAFLVIIAFLAAVTLLLYMLVLWLLDKKLNLA